MQTSVDHDRQLEFDSLGACIASGETVCDVVRAIKTGDRRPSCTVEDGLKTAD